MTSSIRVRRGLPRHPGAAPWPPVDVVDLDRVVVDKAPTPNAEPVELAPSAPQFEVTLRRGLPRVPGGDGWPPVEATQITTAPGEVEEVASAPVIAEPVRQGTMQSVSLRQGLPRVPGGAPWPSAVQAERMVYSVVESDAPAITSEPEETRPTQKVSNAKPADAQKEPTSTAQPKPTKYGMFTRSQWIAVGLAALVGAIALVAALVWGARSFVSSANGTAFIAEHPGHAPLPENAPVGFPAWLAWSHFFNAFLMVLIIRSGIQIRGERKPPAFWSPRKGGAKISLTIWFHMAMDALWVFNGLLFFVLLFATGQWMRIVPTSWDVFPAAASSALQYFTLDWPTENGWVHYNGLQQIAYFVTVFIAAPLAIATGYRMSMFWPKDNDALNKAYPVEVARKLHFPVMIYFVIFIITHVFLVFATGALRNLNHMFAAQGSVDPSEYANNWLGFILFVVATLITVGATIAARPMLLAPVARIFGNVTMR
ncbi:cytochrome b/b6 domain-containing protein [Corynebacterium breve]|uniref:Cytochrome b/b6 domain-containing protein n=1 Tax=Corynebacterium breve TaxID=3049799 RepID=A0ABY8VFZ5_9CORY|nr:cytochrome b/b6 domain-containing protein [Corynebacterium breve]WIM68399.1 cytochrome b/b6 domain-containing protein [Corynebacterium breve]